MKVTDYRRAGAGTYGGTALNSLAIGGVSVSSNSAVVAGSIPVAIGSNMFAWRDALSFGSNANDVSSYSTMGSSPSNTRADHIHRGVHSISHTSNTFYGDVTFTASDSLGITSPTPGTLTFSAPAGGGGGGGGGGGAELLGLTAYAPGSNTTIGSTSSGTDADVDATNLAVAFTAPASGKVLVHLSTLMNDGGGTSYWTVRESTTTLATDYISQATNAARRVMATFYLTGISAGSHTYKWGFYQSVSGTQLVYGGPTFGKAIIEVWAA